MRISGDYYLGHNNRALCPYKYKSAKDVPDFKPWIRVKMPDDFKSRTQVISEFTSLQYEEGGNFKWGATEELYVLFSYEGLIQVNMYPYQRKSRTQTRTLEIDEITDRMGLII